VTEPLTAAQAMAALKRAYDHFYDVPNIAETEQARAGAYAEVRRLLKAYRAARRRGDENPADPWGTDLTGDQRADSIGRARRYRFTKRDRRKANAPCEYAL
jgi:hypothetical protein